MGELFTFENHNIILNELRGKLNFPYISCYSSTLGGRDKISILLCISHDNKENWNNGIKENSKYRHFHIYNNGEVKNFAKHYNLKHIRKFKAKNISHLIEKLNTVKGE